MAPSCPATLLPQPAQIGHREGSPEGRGDIHRAPIPIDLANTCKAAAPAAQGCSPSATQWDAVSGPSGRHRPQCGAGVPGLFTPPVHHATKLPRLPAHPERSRAASRVPSTAKAGTPPRAEPFGDVWLLDRSLLGEGLTLRRQRGPLHNNAGALGRGTRDGGQHGPPRVDGGPSPRPRKAELALQARPRRWYHALHDSKQRWGSRATHQRAGVPPIRHVSHARAWSEKSS